MKPELDFKKSPHWKLEGWDKDKKPKFSAGAERPGIIDQLGGSGHTAYVINGEDHRFFFKLNKKGNSTLSIQEVIAGAPWSVYFPDYSSSSELAYSSNNDVVGAISQGIQEWYELSNEEYPENDDKLKPHQIYVRLEEQKGQSPGRLAYKVTYPHPQVHQGHITYEEIAGYFQKKGQEIPQPDSADYIKKSLKAILAITAAKKHTQPSSTLQRDCQFSSDKTDYFSIAGTMVYSHTNCEDDLHRENILVIKDGDKDVYHRIDFDMSYQSVTERLKGVLLGIAENVRSWFSPRGNSYGKIEVTSKSFKTFPMGINEKLHFWPGVTQNFVGGKHWWQAANPLLGLGSEKGWDEPRSGDRNLTRQFSSLAYHPEFIKWKVYHYARYITTPKSLIENEMESRIAHLHKIKQDSQKKVLHLHQKRRLDPKKPGIDKQLAQARAEYEIHYKNAKNAENLKRHFLKEDSARRKEFARQLEAIPQFVNVLHQNQVEFLSRLEQDNLSFSKSRMGRPNLNEAFSNQYKEFKSLTERSYGKLAEKKTKSIKNYGDKLKIYNEAKFKEHLGKLTALKEVVSCINKLREVRNRSGLFTTEENNRFEKVAREAVIQKVNQQFTDRIQSAQTIPEIQKILTEARHAFEDDAEAFSKIQNLGQLRLDFLQNQATQRLKKEDHPLNKNQIKFSEFLKYAGGTLAVLLLAKTLLPHASFTEIRILGLDVFHKVYAHSGGVAGGLALLSASVTAGWSLFSRKRTPVAPVEHLMMVFNKLKEICHLSDVNHPSGEINALIRKIKSGGDSEIADKLKEEFGLGKEDDQLLISQLTELSRALALSVQQEKTPNKEGVQLDSLKI